MILGILLLPRMPGIRFSVLCGVCIAVLPLVGCGKTETKVDSQEQVIADPNVDPFEIPNRKPAEIVKFIQRLNNEKRSFSTEEEQHSYLEKLKRANIKAGDKLLELNADDASLKTGIEAKLISAIDLASDGDKELAKSLQSEVESLRKHKRKVVVEIANRLWVPVRALNCAELATEDRQKLVDESIQRATEGNLSKESVGEVMFLMENLTRIGDGDSTTNLIERFTELVRNKSRDQNLMKFAQSLKDRIPRLKLVGSKLEIEGKSLDREPFDWLSYRGKIVLVDFWATWCGPCVAELPNVRAAYDKYHDRGFDVIGISLDANRPQLEQFVKGKKLPWTQLFHSADGGHPMATRYNVSSIPTAFLVDRDGNVISTDARGPELKRLLHRLFDQAN